MSRNKSDILKVKKRKLSPEWRKFYERTLEANPDVKDVYARAEWVRKACERTV